jgi:hypothetical protein
VRNKESKGVAYVDQKTGISYKINKSSSFNSTVINALEGPMVIIPSQLIEVVNRNGKINFAGLFVTDEFVPQTQKEI